MNKYKNYYKILTILFMILIIYIISISLLQKVDAENDGIKINIADGGDIISLTESGMDENLYSALLSIYNEAVGNSVGYGYKTILTTKMFSGLNIECLDLSNKNISSLACFNWLEFNSTLTEIKLDYNNLENISKIDNASPFYYIQNSLKRLSVSNNQIEGVELNGFQNLEYLNLNNNQISTVNFSNLKSNKKLNIYLNSNKIKSLDNITMPTNKQSEEVYTLNLIGNKISEIDISIEGYNFVFGIQYSEDKYTTAENFFYNKTNIENFALVISHKESSSSPLIIKDCEIIGKVDLIGLLGIGDYEAYYTNDLISYHNIYNPNDKDFCCYVPFGFMIIPKQPTCKIEINGEEKELSEISELSSTAILRFYSEDGGQIYYKMPNTGEWVKGDYVELTKGGNYTVGIKVGLIDENGTEIFSDESYATIHARLNLYFSNGILLFFVALFTIAVFFVAFPLIKKYVMKN